ncbi:thermonuclease family protein [Methyloligella sp. 2.7D]|uniref:thermonuclease family protein n=1 Tax=unclassified Methyloligella TaxID=2625955 RepID=UPI00157D5575|nr:thermonuclease family protein [Methyloligella sp. GL2]QKP78834.1 thermonuclease family protein [Methyloligella sp. GL2]
MRHLLIISLLALAISPTAAAEFVGSPGKVSDGYTFHVCDEDKCTKIQLCGINAPELGTPAGDAATAALSRLVEERTVKCVQVGDGTPCDRRSSPTSGDRIVAQCFVGGRDIAEVLVRDGHACDWVTYSGGAYSRNNADKQCENVDTLRDSSRANLEVCMNGEPGCNFTVLTNEQRAVAIQRLEEQRLPTILYGYGGSVSIYPCDHSWQTARDGSRCGGRAADQRLGGR